MSESGRRPRGNAVNELLDVEARTEARYLDLQLDFVAYKSGTPIARFGGLWDRFAKDFAGDAATSRVIEVHAQQIAAVRTFDRWFAEHLRGGDPANDRVREIIEGDIEVIDVDLGLAELFFTGGRRSGKTTIAESLGTGYLIAVPEATAWTVVPSENFFREPRKVLESVMLATWYSWAGDPRFSFELANGSEHALMSAHKATQLKKGEAAIVVVNEAQQIGHASYTNARGAVVDAGGLALVAANPPTVGDVGMWVADAITQIAKGARPGAEHIFIDPMDNPHIDRRKLLAMRAGMTAHDWETQIRGRMLALPDQVLYAWDRVHNEHRTPDFGDITRAFLKAHEGEDRELDQVLVVDVQTYPWIAAGVFRIFRDPRAPADPREGLLWMVDEIAMAQGDELDVAHEALRRGYSGDRTLVIMDASCDWQQATRDLTKQRPEYRGKGSMHMFRSAGYKLVVPPDRRMKGNPDVLERVRATNARLKNGDGMFGLYVDPRCCNAVESAQRWRVDKTGRPSRSSRSAHFGDVLGYAVWRFWPRRRRDGGGVVDVEVLGDPRAERRA